MTFPFLPAVHFTKGREAKIDTIVLHWMAGTLASTDATFTGGAREASAHYGIEDAKVHQYVKDTDTAWHSGDRPTNHRSIGIEHSAAPGRPATTATIASSVALCVALCRKYGISPDRIYPHKKFYNTACPGTLPVADIVARVRAQLARAPLTTPSRSTVRPPITKPFPLSFGHWFGVRSSNPLNHSGYAVADRPAIKAIQVKVHVTPSGAYDLNTRNHVMTAQKAARIAVDGTVGPQTWNVLKP